MGDALVQSATIQLKDIGGGFFGSKASGGSWYENYGLLWDDGVEPVNSTLYPLASGKRIWYVDLDAVTNGDGSELSPLNHFTDLVGWWDGVNYHQGTLGFSGGDQIWITGTATPAKHSNGVTNMNIYFKRDNQFGTSADPTVIRSWKGKSRALFDGEYTESLGILAQGVTEAGNALAILNIAGTRCTSPTINIADAVEWARVVSCYTYYNYALAGGASSTYGGIVVRCTTGLRDIAVHNCKTHNNNTSDGVTLQSSNNIGGISLLCEDSADPLSIVEFYLNETYDENYGFRHKHSGIAGFNAYNNVIHDVNVAMYIRNAGVNNLHHNICHDVSASCLILEAENQAALKRITNYENNTSARCGGMVGTSATETYQNDLRVNRNIHYDPLNNGTTITLGGYGSSNYNSVDTSSENNDFFVGSYDPFYKNNGVNGTLTEFKTLAGDTTSITLDPLFVDAANNDYTLQAGSPAISLNGNRVGAL